MSEIVAPALGSVLERSDTAINSNGSARPSSNLEDVVADFGDGRRSDISVDVAAVLSRARSLASQLNHKEVGLPHLMYALTLIPAGSAKLKTASHPFDLHKVREAGWRELGMIGPLNESAQAIGASKEIRDLNEFVQETVRRNYDSSHQTIHIKDLVEGLLCGPTASKIRESYMGAPTIPTTDQARVMIRDVKFSADQHLPRLDAWTQDIRTALLGDQDLLSSTEPRIGGIKERTEKLQRDLQDGQETIVEEFQDTRRAISEGLAKLNEGQSRNERQIQKLKTATRVVMALAILTAGLTLSALVTQLLHHGRPW